MGESFTLMEASRSRQSASLSTPRVIMYGTDARFLMAVSSTPTDPLYAVIEMAELDLSTGNWRFRDLDLSTGSPHVGADDIACRSCHGNPARPIWEPYAQWHGAYGGDDPMNPDTLSDAQTVELRLLSSEAASSDRFFGLGFPTPYMLDQKSFYLPARYYGYANTVFGFELGARVAEGLFARMHQSSQYARARWDVLAGTWCDAPDRVLPAISQLGLDPANDFDIADPISGATATTQWNQGSTSLLDIVAFLVLNDVLATDAELANATASIEARRLELLNAWFGVRGAARRSFVKSSDFGTVFDFRPQELVAPVKSSLCQIIAARQHG
jgi:hypothetical protein